MNSTCTQNKPLIEPGYNPKHLTPFPCNLQIGRHTFHLLISYELENPRTRAEPSSCYKTTTPRILHGGRARDIAGLQSPYRNSAATRRLGTHSLGSGRETQALHFRRATSGQPAKIEEPRLEGNSCRLVMNGRWGAVQDDGDN